MSIQVSNLFELARKVELAIAAIYEDIATHLKPGSEESRFFAKMAAQEHIHAAWVDEMMAVTDPEFVIETLEESDFSHTLDSLKDIHDEVIHDTIDLPSTLEIALHLENSTAEEFYLHFPDDMPGLPHEMLKRMVQSCFDHAKMVAKFREGCIKSGQAGVHMPDQND